jgi:hypothetical protein
VIAQPAIMSGVLSVVYGAIATHLIRKAGYTQKSAHTGAVSLIQCFGSALNLNIHFQMRFLDGVYVNGAKVQTPVSVESMNTSACRRVGRHRRLICLAEIRKPVIQHAACCELDRRGRIPPGRLAGICLDAVESARGACSFR